jgi:hypothetical protein
MGRSKNLVINKNMNAIDEILKHYEKPVMCEQEVNETQELAHQHLTEYLIGDGDVRHLYEYYDLMDKI